MCHAIGAWGEPLLVDGSGVLTHCNAGGLATSGYGTALAVIFTACERGKSLHVYVDETRPLLQGARLTAWELQQRRIPATLLCDSMAAQVMREDVALEVGQTTESVTVTAEASLLKTETSQVVQNVTLSRGGVIPSVNKAVAKAGKKAAKAP